MTLGMTTTVAIFQKSLSEPWFSLIKLGLKTCEGRLKKGDFSNMVVGDYIIFENSDFDIKRTIKVEITDISYYDTFYSYLESETLTKCLPGIDTLSEGLAVYYKYFSIADEINNGIVAIKIKMIK